MLYDPNNQQQVMLDKEYRSFLLCLRNRLPGTDSRYEARAVVSSCSGTYNNPNVNSMATYLMSWKFPSDEDLKKQAEWRQQQQLEQQQMMMLMPRIMNCLSLGGGMSVCN